MSGVLARFLLDLADRGGDKAARRRTFRLNARRADIAWQLGMHPTALEAALGRLVARRAISLDGDTVTILDRAALERARSAAAAALPGERAAIPLGASSRAPSTPEDAVRAVLADERFLAAPRTSALLAYLAGRALAGETAEPDPARIGIEALGLPPGHDPSRDPTLRVLLGRLRRMLDEHYADDDRHEFRLRIAPGACRLLIQSRPARSSRDPRGASPPPSDDAPRPDGDGADPDSAPDEGAAPRSRGPADESGARRAAGESLSASSGERILGGEPSAGRRMSDPRADGDAGPSTPDLPRPDAADDADLIERLADDYLLGRLVPCNVHATCNDLQVVHGAAELLSAEPLSADARRRLTLIAEAAADAIGRTGALRTVARRGGGGGQEEPPVALLGALAGHAERLVRLTSDDDAPSVEIERRAGGSPTGPAMRRTAERAIGCLVLHARTLGSASTTPRLRLGVERRAGADARWLVLDLRCAAGDGAHRAAASADSSELVLLSSLVMRAGGTLRRDFPSDGSTLITVSLPLREPDGS